MKKNRILIPLKFISRHISLIFTIYITNYAISYGNSDAQRYSNRPAFFVVFFFVVVVCFVFFFQLKGKNLHKFFKAGDYPTLQVR